MRDGMYATGLRIAQYGWTPQRMWAVLTIGVTLVASVCYSLSVIDKRPEWLPHITQFNKPLSLLVVLLVIAVNSPLLDPYRISVNNQIARLDEGKTQAKDLDLSMLRFDTGRRGNEALKDLQQNPAFMTDPRLMAILKNTISQTSRWGSYGWRCRSGGKKLSSGKREEMFSWRKARFHRDTGDSLPTGEIQ